MTAHARCGGSPRPVRPTGAGAGEAMARLMSPDFDAWSSTAARVGHCARPVKLVGSSQRVDTRTGEVLSTYSSAHEPLGLTYVRCGNRRASECPACSRIYAADTFHLIRSGVVGGKTVPEHVVGESVGVRHPDRALVRARPRHT